jgi:hypothetical protein
MSIEEITSIVAAPKHARAVVKAFLAKKGVEVVVDDGDVIRCTASVASASLVFDTTFYEFTHVESGTFVIPRCARIYVSPLVLSR